jgi:hypothetical protein
VAASRRDRGDGEQMRAPPRARLLDVVHSGLTEARP